jgi:hypothetical protein
MIIDEYRLGRNQVIALREVMENLGVGLHQAHLSGDHDAAKAIPVIVAALEEREHRGGHVGEPVEGHAPLCELVEERYGIGHRRQGILDVLHEGAHLGGGTVHAGGEALDRGVLVQGTAIDVDPVRMAEYRFAHERARGLVGVEPRDDGLGVPANEHAAEIENDVADRGCVQRVLLMVSVVVR